MLNAENFRANVRNRFQDVIKDENKSVNLEKALYNYTIKEAGFRKIVKKWENGVKLRLNWLEAGMRNQCLSQ